MSGRPVRPVLTAMLAVTAAAVLVPGLLAVVLGVAARQPAMSGHDTVTLIGLLWTGAFGVHPSAGATLGGMTAQVTLTAWPLTITVVGLGAAALTLRRTSRTLGVRSATAVAAVASLVTGGVLVIVAAVCREGLPGLTGALTTEVAGRVPILSGMISGLVATAHGHVGSPVGPSLGHGVLLTGVVLAAALLCDRVPVLSPALTGLSRLLVLLPVAGAVGIGVLALTGRHTGGELPFALHAHTVAGLVSALVAYAADAGVWLLTLGVGDRGHVTLGLPGHDVTVADRVGGLAAHFHEPGLWVALALAPVVIGWASYAATRRARELGRPWAVTGWIVVAIVAPPLLVHATDIDGSAALSHLGLLALALPDPLGVRVQLGVGTAGAIVLAGYAVLMTLAVLAALRGAAPSTPRPRRPSAAADPRDSASRPS